MSNSNPKTSASTADEPTSSYTRIQDDASSSARSTGGNLSLGEQSGSSYQSGGNRSLHSLQRRAYLVEKAARDATGVGGIGGVSDHPPLLEIPEEIYQVRKAALRVLKPLTRTWVRTIFKFFNVTFSFLPPSSAPHLTFFGGKGTFEIGESLFHRPSPITHSLTTTLLFVLYVYSFHIQRSC
jgi:hypothetical protein